MIGQENRRNLKSLEMQMPRPLLVLEHSDGTRSFLADWPLSKAVPCNTHLGSYSTFSMGGWVNHLDPAIEACFCILGKNRPALTLMLRLDRDHLPGVHVIIGYPFPDMHEFGLKLSVVIEKFRQDFTVNSDGTSQVEVLWKGECKRDLFAEQTKFIQD